MRDESIVAKAVYSTGYIKAFMWGKVTLVTSPKFKKTARELLFLAWSIIGQENTKSSPQPHHLIKRK